MAGKAEPAPCGWKEDIKRRHGRRAHRAECGRCGAPVWSGLDDDWGAFAALADPAPIDPAAELRFLLQGLATYTFDGSQLTHRRDGLLAPRTGRLERPVLVQHRCGITIQPSPPKESSNVDVDDDCPPF